MSVLKLVEVTFPAEERSGAADVVGDPSEGMDFVEIGEVSLKGVADPVLLYSAKRSSGA